MRQTGRSYAHPLVVLIALHSLEKKPRFAVSASRSVGNAVHRNRAKRIIREAVRPLIPSIPSGWDVVILARQPVIRASLDEVRSAIAELARRAGIFTGMESKDVATDGPT